MGLSYTEIAYSYREDYDYETDENIEAWNDILESYNGIPILYDEIGNPTDFIEYLDDTEYIMGTHLEWEGRQLQSYNKGEGISGVIDEFYETVEFKYNADGIRTQKIVNGVRHEYVLNGTQVVRETIYNSSLNRYIAKDIRYFYDAEGRPTAIRYFTLDASGAVTGDTIYYLGTNLQGDVIAIYDSTGTKIYTYEYDAWGNLIRGCQLATGGSAANSVNPFRYRGYYYDIETGLYYLQSRYYNPQWGRFLNADDSAVITATPMGLTDKNLYAYCDNNPIMRKDGDGDFWETALDIVSLGFSIADVCKDPSDPWAWAGLIGDAVDLIPFVSGVGEVTRAVNTGRKVLDAADDVHDAVNVADNIGDSVKTLHRPYIRKSTRDAVEAAAKRAPDGKFLDASTGKVITGKYDLGHEFGHEFWRERDMAMSKGWTQKQFNDYMNNPTFYRIEDPLVNRSHKFEMPQKFN